MAGIETTVGASLPQSPAFSSGLSTQPIWDMLIRNRIIPAIIDARNNAVPLLGMLYKDKQHVAGKFVIQTVRSGRNYAGVSAMHAEGNMPDPGRQGAYQYATAVRDIYARIKLTGRLLRAADGDMASLASPLEFETKGVIDDLSIKQEIMVHGDGSGRRAEFVSHSGAAGGVITVRHNQDNEGIANCPSPATIWLDVGMRVTIVSAGGTVRAASSGQQAWYVTSVPSSTTITVSTSLGGSAVDFSVAANQPSGAIAGDFIVDATRDSSMSTTSTVPLDTAWKQEPMGLEGILRDIGCNDGTGISTAGQQTGSYDYTQTSATASGCGFQGIQVNGTAITAAYPPPQFNKAIVLDAAGGGPRTINDLLLQQAISLTKKQNNATITDLVSAYEMYDAYFATLVGDKRFNTTNLQGGHNPEGGIGFNGLPWHRSRYMLGGRVQGVDRDMLHIWENQPLAPATAPGGNVWERTRDTDAFWQAMVTSYQLVTDCRDRTGFHLVDLQ